MKNYIVKKLKNSSGYLPVLSKQTDKLISVRTFFSDNDSTVRVAKIITGLEEYSIYAPLSSASEITINLDDYNDLLEQIIDARKNTDDELSAIYDDIYNKNNQSLITINYISQDDFKKKIEDNIISSGVNVIVYNEYNMYNTKITNLNDPIQDNDATTLNYFDQNIWNKFLYIKNKFEELLTKINDFLNKNK